MKKQLQRLKEMVDEAEGNAAPPLVRHVLLLISRILGKWVDVYEPTKWKYDSHVAPWATGQTIAWINQHHPEWDVVQILTVANDTTVVIYREEL